MFAQGLAAVNFVLLTFNMAIEEAMAAPPEIRHTMPRFDLEIYAASDVQLDISRSRVVLSIDLPEYKASAAGVHYRGLGMCRCFEERQYWFLSQLFVCPLVSRHIAQV